MTKATIADALAYIKAYNDALDNKGIAPNGDDFNAICNALTAILTGREPDHIVIKHSGR